MSAKSGAGLQIGGAASMNTGPYIFERFRREFPFRAPRGQRHLHMVKLAPQLLAAGFTPDAIFVQFRHQYPSDVTDREIQDIITWAAAKISQPCSHAWKSRNYHTRNLRRVVMPDRVTSEEATANAEKWLGDSRINEADLWEASPWRPLEDWRFDSLMLMAGLYAKEERINVIADFTLEHKDSERANPKGAGKTLLRDDWMRLIRDHGTPQTQAGAWIRPNPVQERGSGWNGSITEADVTSYRFCLLESDALP